MKRFWRYLKQQTWLMFLPLLLTATFGTTALAAQTPTFSATAFGPTNNLSVTATLNVADADVGKSGNNYLGFNFNKTWYFHNGIGWAPFNSGAVPIYAAAPLVNRTIEVLRSADVSDLLGGQLFVGYGLTESDMLANGKYGMVYTVTDTTPPTVTGTLYTNGATNVAINTKVGITFSEAMAPSTINDANFTLKETASGIAVAGIVSYSGVNATFIPFGDLAANTGYTVTVKGGINGVHDLAGNALTSDFTVGCTTGAAADTTAPTVTGTIHANGATNVIINTKVGVTFSEGMNPSTVTNTNFTLNETVTGTAVAGTVSYSGVTATLIPSSNLKSNTGYTVTVKGGANGVKDLAGNPLANDFIISWATGAVADTIAPTVTGTMHASGATNVPVNTKVGIAFSEAMDPLTITNVNFTLKETVSGTAVAGTVSYSGTTATFIPLSNLAGNTGYTATVKSSAKDLAGNPMTSDFVISWTTAVVPDTAPPTVTGTINVNGATGVAINTKIGATFSEALDPLTMTNVNFTLKKTSDGSAVTGTVGYSGVNAVFVPLDNLSSGTQYTVTVKGGASGVKDLAGNALASDYVWSWTTADYVWEPSPTPPLDRTAPTVTGTTIADTATNVAINPAVGATFSEGMDPLTVTTANFTLKKTLAPFTAVVGLITNSGGNNWVFTPSSNLASDTSYTATISTGVKDLAGNPLASDKIWSFTTVPLAIDLGAAAPFEVLASSAISNGAAITTVTGDIGIATKTLVSITGFAGADGGPGIVNGTIYASNTPVIAGDTTSSTARAALGTAYQAAKTKGAAPGVNTLAADELGGLTLTPGVYHFGGALKIQAGSLKLDAQGDCEASWIIDMDTTLTTIAGAGGDVTLLNCADAKNIWWRVGSSATLGGAIFKGNILADTSISVGTVAVAVTGRLLAAAVNDGAVTFDAHAHTASLP